MIKVLFGGAFDLIHLGHIMAMKKAKECGDYLVVNVNSDKQVRNKKGKERPIIPGRERIEMVKAIRYVDEVYYDEDAEYLDIEKLLDTVKPDILVLNHGEKKGYFEDEQARKRGITVVEFKRSIPESHLNTTRIIAKIRKEDEDSENTSSKLPFDST